jgi:uncharacterized protein (DUF433 family)
MHAFQPRLPPLAEDTDGVLRVGGTRVTLDSVLIAFDRGATPEEIAHRYPALEIASIYEVIGYVLRNRPIFDEYLARRQEDAEKTKAEIERRFPPDGIRQRLIARGASGASR